MSDVQKIAYPFDEGLALIGKSRSGGYKAVAEGSLKTYMDGRRRMITHKALMDYVASLELGASSVPSRRIGRAAQAGKAAA